MSLNGFELNNLIYFKFNSPLDVFKAIAEILCITYFIYVLLNLVRETRTWQLLRGVILIVLLTAISNLMELRTLAFILNNTFGFLAIGMVVVFQQELRRGLEQIGRSALKVFFNTDTQRPSLNMVESIVHASAELSKTMTGALIVLERQTKLGEIIETGILLGADVSTELLVNIFTKNAPLHDGAVVIRNRRIEAATCYLPLTEDGSVEKELGTRHRAALGITEVTDALAVIVSEETGSVSFAVNGRITRGLNEESLRKLLIEGYEEFSSASKRIPIFRHKAKAK